MNNNKGEFWDQSLCRDEMPAAAAEFDYKKFLGKFLRSWKTLLIWFVAAGLLGSLIAIGIPRQYKVVSKMAPELSLRSTSLTTLASLTGASMLSGNNDALLPTVYPDIVGSTTFIAGLLNAPIGDGTLYDYMENDIPTFWLKKVVFFPLTAAGWVKDLFSPAEDEEVENTIDPYRLTKKQYSVCRALDKMIEVTVDKKTFLVTITVIMPDKEVAASVSRLVIDNLKEYVTEYRTKKAVDNAEYLERVTAEAHDNYLKAQSEYASYMDRNQSVTLKSNLLKGVDYQNKANLNFQLYSSLAAELQQARTKVKQETPVFAEIVPPTVPVRSANSRKKIALAFAFIGLLASCVYVSVKSEKSADEGSSDK